MARPSKEYTEFVKLTDRLLAVPHAEIQKRVAQHREEAANNPRKRGPKPKRVTASASASGHDEP